MAQPAFCRDEYAPWLERTRFHDLSPYLQKLEKELCRRDPVYFITRWCFTFDPRREGLKALPFGLYPFQVSLIRDLQEHAAVNWHVDKSRDMGITWTMLAYFTWRFIFEPGYSALLLSKKADDVDNKTISSLIPKIEFILKRLPAWLRPRYERSYMRIINLDNEGTFICGAATTDDAGRSGRYTDVLLDEFASVERSYALYAAVVGNLARRVIFLSTPKGRGNKFADLKFATDIDIIKRSYHWSLHPRKTQEWYEAEKRRIADPVVVAAELDISYTASVRGRIFPMVSRDKHLKSWDIADDTEKRTGWDFGAVLDPTVCLWYEVFEANGQRCLYFYRELHDSDEKELPAWWAREFLERSEPLVHEGYGDPAGDQRERDMVSYVDELWTTTKNLIDSGEFRGRKPLVISSRKVARNYAIMAMRKGFATKRIFISEQCPSLFEAVLNYRAKVPREGAERTRNEAHIEQLDPVHDWCSHFCDALRYALINELPDLLSEDVQRPDSGVLVEQEENSAYWRRQKNDTVDNLDNLT